MKAKSQPGTGPRICKGVRPVAHLRAGVFLVAACVCFPAWASASLQAQGSAEAAPSLQHRTADDADDDSDLTGLQRGRTRLPPEASGEYALRTSGEVIEITIQDKRVTGYISRLGDKSSDKGTPLTYFFRLSTLHDDEITFTTRAVHGVWYSFRGAIVRGELDADRERSGYLLVGTLTEHSRGGDSAGEDADDHEGDRNAETAQATRVRLPQLPTNGSRAH